MSKEKDSNREKVIKWIEENFDTKYITMSDFSLLPGGILIRDSNGATMLVWHDILTGEVVYRVGQ